MDCPSHEQLSIYHDGELPTADMVALRRHLSGCADCARQIENLDRLALYCRCRLPTMECLTDQEIAEITEGKAASEVVSRARSHTRECHYCEELCSKELLAQVPPISVRLSPVSQQRRTAAPRMVAWGGLAVAASLLLVLVLSQLPRHAVSPPPQIAAAPEIPGPSPDGMLKPGSVPAEPGGPGQEVARVPPRATSLVRLASVRSRSHPMPNRRSRAEPPLSVSDGRPPSMSLALVEGSTPELFGRETNSLPPQSIAWRLRSSAEELDRLFLPKFIGIEGPVGRDFVNVLPKGAGPGLTSQQMQPLRSDRNHVGPAPTLQRRVPDEALQFTTGR